jgi:hypothetical protein
MVAYKEFHINQYLSVRFVQEQTRLYVGGEHFIQCKSLIFNIPIPEIKILDDIDSIDEVEEKPESFFENGINRTKIPSDVEFWGHCSNLQVWYEHGYDTRLLHSNLAFALLGKLAEVGDPLAKKVFKSELIYRYENGTDRTRKFIRDSKALGYLSKEEALNLMLKTEDLLALTEFVGELWAKYDPYRIIFALISEENVILEDRKVVELNFSGVDLELEKFPESVLKLKDLRVLVLTNNYFKDIPETISELTSLKKMCLDFNEISQIPKSICEMTLLEHLSLGNNKIETLPEKMRDLKQLKTLKLAGNKITELTESIYNLKSLETLSLASNNLKDLPEGFCNLISLKSLSLSNNKLKKLPECFLNLKNLKYLDLSKNPFLESQEILEKIKKSVKMNLF